MVFLEVDEVRRLGEIFFGPSWDSGKSKKKIVGGEMRNLRRKHRKLLFCPFLSFIIF
jgi:hypothetical protein